MSEKQLVGTKCNSCGKIMYPKRVVCSNCRARDLADVQIGDEGRLLTYTYLYATPEGIDQMPLVLGIVEFDNGVRVTGQIEDREVKIGDRLLPIWGLLRKGRAGKEVYGFKFKLSPGERMSAR